MRRKRRERQVRDVEREQQYIPRAAITYDFDVHGVTGGLNEETLDE